MAGKRYRRPKGGLVKRQPSKNPAPNAEEEIISSLNNISLGEIRMTFEELDISRDLLRGLHAYGLEKPSAIQQRAIPHLKRGRDVILQAQSGMGKTVAFCLGILERIKVNERQIQAILLTPTRELAEQTFRVFEQLAQYSKIKTVACYGGTKVKRDRAEIDKGVHIVVGTLGRVLHLIREKTIQLLPVNIFALDEADKMVTDDTFANGIEEILEGIDGDAQIVVASATMPPGALDVALSFMRTPVKFLINKDELTLDGIKQYFVSVEGEDAKVEALRDFYPKMSESHAVIFCSSRSKVKWLSKRLASHGIEIPAMTGDISQRARDELLEGFRRGEIRVLITSDVLGRGVDVQQLYAVINYDLPLKQVDYIHRVGRGGRYGRKGVAISLVDDKEQKVLDAIREYFDTDIQALMIADWKKIW